jgi:tRNA pseudouridine55 synthase
MMNGALLVNKHPEISSFGVIELLQKQLRDQSSLKKKELPKLGHGGTLDPFATGLLIVLVGRAVKLARYFLGSTKCYQGVIRFGETTIPGDPTEAVTEISAHIPQSLEELQSMAHSLTQQPYPQTPPMHSAKKRNGKPLYELARAGIEVEREPKICHLYQFEIQDYQPPRAQFMLKCSSGTYVRTLSQDYAKRLGSVALLESLHRIGSGIFQIQDAWSVEAIQKACLEGGQTWNELPCWIDFNDLLKGYDRAEATEEDQLALYQGKQNVLFNILKNVQPASPRSSEKDDCVAIYCKGALIGIARREQGVWGIERVFC